MIVATAYLQGNAGTLNPKGDPLSAERVPYSVLAGSPDASIIWFFKKPLKRRVVRCCSALCTGVDF